MTSKNKTTANKKQENEDKNATTDKFYNEHDLQTPPNPSLRHRKETIKIKTEKK